MLLTANSKKMWFLSQINLFSAMTPQDMQQMESITSMCQTAKNEIVYLPGDPADSIYLLKQGRVRISRLSEDGKQMTLSLMEPGSIFGELALLDDQSEQDSIAEALEDTILCIIRKVDFEKFLEMHPTLNLKVTKLIGFRLRQVTNQMESLIFKSAEQRLADLLQRLSRDYPKVVSDGVMINLNVTHRELGELTNIARQTVTELLQRLVEKGIIRFEKRRIVVIGSRH